MSVKYTLISSFKPLQAGDTFKDEWPLHVTIQTWFDLPEGGLEKIRAELAAVRANLRYCTIIGGDSELFGPDLTIPVRLIKDQTELQILHDKIQVIVTNCGGNVWNPAFVGAGYRAHVTDTQSGKLLENESAEVTSMSLIRGDVEGERVVVDTYNFLGKR